MCYDKNFVLEYTFRRTFMKDLNTSQKDQIEVYYQKDRLLENVLMVLLRSKN